MKTLEQLTKLSKADLKTLLSKTQRFNGEVPDAQAQAKELLSLLMVVVYYAPETNFEHIDETSFAGIGHVLNRYTNVNYQANIEFALSLK